jgi:hypothetical protein
MITGADDVVDQAIVQVELSVFRRQFVMAIGELVIEIRGRGERLRGRPVKGPGHAGFAIGFGDIRVTRAA